MGPRWESTCCQWWSLNVHSAWWRHQMETFSALLAICTGNLPVTGEFPDKGQCRVALMFSLVCSWINDWVNNFEAGDLRRHRVHYDVTAMVMSVSFATCLLRCNIYRKIAALHDNVIKNNAKWKPFPQAMLSTRRYVSDNVLPCHYNIACLYR